MNTPKLTRDLQFLTEFRTYCLSQKWRLVLYGGYGLDFWIGKITREHRDLDLVVYGQSGRSHAHSLLTQYLTSTLSSPEIKISENDFQLIIDVHSGDFILDLSYIQTLHDPTINLHTVVKKSGEQVINSPNDFPPPQQGRIGDLIFEVQDQNSHRQDIIAKGNPLYRKYAGDLKLIDSLLPKA